MAGATNWITTRQSGGVTEVHLSGHWSLEDAGQIDAIASNMEITRAEAAVLDVGAIEYLDTAGAWLVEKLRRRLSSAEHTVPLRNVKPDHSVLLNLIGGLADGPAAEPPSYRASPEPYFTGILCSGELGRYSTTDDPDALGGEL